MLAALAVSAFALDTSKLKPTGYVNDFAHALDPAGKARLETYCTTLEQSTGVQMAIVTVDTLDDEPVEDVGNRLFREWGIGKKGKDNGVLMLFAIKDHKSSVELGYGIEPIISDGDAGDILRGIRPILRQGNYAGAFLAAAQEIGNRIAQEQGVDLPGAPPRTARPAGRPDRDIPAPILIGGFFLLCWLVFQFIGGGSGRSGSGRGSGVGGFLTGMILGNILGRGGSGWGGGGFGGSSGGGGGFGGFGGGDSGGGGASSDW